jgi:molybdopterin converting factor subunit 1
MRERQMITVRVRFFAGHRDIVGRPEIDLPQAEGATVGTLWEQLTAAYPRLAGYSGRLLYAVNQEFAGLATELHDGDEVAYIPPVSGGRGAAGSRKQ